MVHSRAGLAHVGETKAVVQHASKFMRLILPRHHPGLMDRSPKAIAGMGVIMAHVGGPLASSGADEDQF